jgi:hypothetical protein
MSAIDEKKCVFLILILGVLIIGSILFFVKVGGLVVERTGTESKRMGYCFDVALDQAKERLFAACGQKGLHILDTQNGKLAYLTTYHDDGYYRNLKIHGDRVFVAGSPIGLAVFDISGESAIRTWVQTNAEACGLHIEGDLAFVAACKDGLLIFDITDPDFPVFISALQTPGSAWDIWVQDGFAYLADFHAGMTVVDISNPAKPRLVGTTTWVDHDQTAEIVRGEGEVVYIAAGPHGLIIIDVSDPYQPVVASRYHPMRINFAEGLAVKNGILYLAVGSEFLWISTIENGLHILDVSDAYAPKLLSKAHFTDWVEGVQVDEGLIYVANTWNGARLINAEDIFQPYVASTFDKFP